MRLTLRLIAMAAIAGFWATMWAFLIRSELRPDQTALHTLPVELVWKQMFEHEQVSDLFLRENNLSIGRLRLEPRARPPGYALGVSGNLQFTPAGVPPQHASWEGSVMLDGKFHVLEIQGTYRSLAPPALSIPPARLQFTADLVKKEGWYRYHSGDEIVAEQRFTLDLAGFAEVLKRWEIDPTWSRQFTTLSGDHPAQVTARQTRFTLPDVQGETVDATLVALTMHGQSWLEIYLSQLGQVLQVKTLWGWVLEGQ